MNQEQFTLLMNALTRIIELLEKADKPRQISVVNQRGLPGELAAFMSNTPYDKMPPMVDAIAKQLSDADTQ